MVASLAAAWQRSPLARLYRSLSASWSPRERALVLLCAGALGLALAYAAIAPLVEFRQDAVRRYAAQLEDVAWMKANRARAEAERLGDSGSQARMSTINAAAKRLDLPLRRIQPESDGFSVRIEAQPFDDVIQWSYALESRHGIEVVSANIDVQAPGVVNARLRVR